VFDIADGSVGAAQMGAGLTPIRNVDGPDNPTLPNVAYPANSLIYNLTDQHLYKTTDGLTWIDLGDSSLIVGQIQAAQIATGAIEFEKLGSSATDVIASHIPNNSFALSFAGPLTMGTSAYDPWGHTAVCPYWTAWRYSGAGTATVVVDASWPGGKYVECRFSAVGEGPMLNFVTNDVCLTSDLFPVVAGQNLSASVVAQFTAAAGQVSLLGVLEWFTAAGTYLGTQDTVLEIYADAVRNGQDVFRGTETNRHPTAPFNARYARLSLGMMELDVHNSGNFVRIGAAEVHPTAGPEDIETSYYPPGTDGIVYAFDTVSTGQIYLGVPKLTAGITFPDNPKVDDLHDLTTDHTRYYFDGGQWIPTGTSAALETTENYLNGDVAMTNSGTSYDGPSVYLGPGTWLLTGAICVKMPYTNNGWVPVKLWDGGSSVLDSPAGYCSLQGGGVVVPVQGVVWLTSPKTYKISAIGYGMTGCTILASDPTGYGATNKASHLTAVRIAT
jgi:hypothetical protein